MLYCVLPPVGVVQGAAQHGAGHLQGRPPGAAQPSASHPPRSALQRLQVSAYPPVFTSLLVIPSSTGRRSEARHTLPPVPAGEESVVSLPPLQENIPAPPPALQARSTTMYFLL